ncbi:MAG: creatininase family protein [Nitrosopumilus sp.]|nr:creatininase family protein [Nitrosopumilus sp.]MDA7943902.1 creatininase family protein [Nitrosopumilus sp.]MDA7953476.1 creatininase family protein [Nitrosopumilus sp.]MDA7958791.1 creatininase family protein [Nitrosopumilus sp.]MDA7959936.1 creatininase family protein [Nitrosopumilus sp.]
MARVRGTDPSIRAALAGGAPAFLPVGSAEQHGAHLGVTTDADIAQEVSRRLASVMGGVLLPGIGYGVSREHAPLFNASLSPAVLRGVVRDVCRSVGSCGARAIFVVNGHRGNLDALRRPFAGRGMPEVRVMHYWRHMKEGLGHAGRTETSLALAAGCRAYMSEARRGLVTEGMDPAEISRLARLASRSFPEAAPGGVWGDPRGASAARGRALLAAVTRSMRAECVAVLRGIPNC